MKLCISAFCLILTLLCVSERGLCLENPHVEVGLVNIDLDANSIKQVDNKAVIRWDNFDIASQEHFVIEQPDKDAFLLNRVMSDKETEIRGKLTANGNVIIANSNGIVFYKDSKIDVGGLLATTAHITPEDFMSDKISDVRSVNDAIIKNNGSLLGSDFVSLIAPHVINDGYIKAEKVYLSGSNGISLDFTGDRLLGFNVGDGARYLQNTGNIDAEGGEVYLTVEEGLDVFESLITISGEIKAPVVSEKGGVIRILAPVEGKQVRSSHDAESRHAVVIQKSVLDASSEDSRGGVLDIVGDSIVIDKTSIKANGNLSEDFVNQITEGQSATFNYSLDSISNGESKIRYTAKQLTDGSYIYTINGDEFDLANAIYREEEFLKSPYRGGGSIKIGGDCIYRERTKPNARNIVITSSVTIESSGIERGDGGRITIWAEEELLDLGKHFAKGGSEYGDGGLVDTSAPVLHVKGIYVCLDSPQGHKGYHLVDPYVVKNKIADNSLSDASLDPIWDAYPQHTCGVDAGMLYESINPDVLYLHPLASGKGYIDHVYGGYGNVYDFRAYHSLQAWPTFQGFYVYGAIIDEVELQSDYGVSELQVNAEIILVPEGLLTAEGDPITASDFEIVGDIVHFNPSVIVTSAQALHDSTGTTLNFGSTKHQSYREFFKDNILFYNTNLPDSDILISDVKSDIESLFRDNFPWPNYIQEGLIVTTVGVGGRISGEKILRDSNLHPVSLFSSSSLSFADPSIATVEYVTDSSSGSPVQYIEVYDVAKDFAYRVYDPSVHVGGHYPDPISQAIGLGRKYSYSENSLTSYEDIFATEFSGPLHLKRSSSHYGNKMSFPGVPDRAYLSLLDANYDVLHSSTNSNFGLYDELDYSEGPMTMYISVDDRSAEYLDIFRIDWSPLKIIPVFSGGGDYVIVSGGYPQAVRISYTTPISQHSGSNHLRHFLVALNEEVERDPSVRVSSYEQGQEAPGVFDIVTIPGSGKTRSPLTYLDYSVTGTLTVTSSKLQVQMDAYTVEYGDAHPSFLPYLAQESIDVLASHGLTPSDVISAYPTYSTPATQTSNVGDYAIAIDSGTGTIIDSRFTFDYTNSSSGTLTINPAPLILGATNQTGTYGDALPTFELFIASGLKLDHVETDIIQSGNMPGYIIENLEVLNNAIISGVGNYDVVIVIDVGSEVKTTLGQNYDIIEGVVSTLTVERAKLHFDVNDAMREYKAPDPVATSVLYGLQFEDARENVIAIETYTFYDLSSGTEVTYDTNAGEYVVRVVDNKVAIDESFLDKYEVEYANNTSGQFTINAAVLLVTPIESTRQYQQAEPLGRYYITGYKGNETRTVLTEMPVNTTDALFESPIGTYTFGAAAGSAVNYIFTYGSDTTLEITQRDILLPVTGSITDIPMRNEDGDIIYFTIGGIDADDASLFIEALLTYMEANEVLYLEYEGDNSVHGVLSGEWVAEDISNVYGNYISNQPPINDVLKAFTFESDIQEGDSFLTVYNESTGATSAITIYGDEHLTSAFIESVNAFLDEHAIPGISIDNQSSAGYLTGIVAHIGGSTQAIYELMGEDTPVDFVEAADPVGGGVFYAVDSGTGEVVTAILDIDTEIAVLLGEHLQQYIEEENIDGISFNPADEYYIYDVIHEIALSDPSFKALEVLYLQEARPEHHIMIEEVEAPGEGILPIKDDNGNIIYAEIQGLSIKDRNILTEEINNYLINEGRDFVSLDYNNEHYIGSIVQEIGGSTEAFYEALNITATKLQLAEVNNPTDSTVLVESAGEVHLVEIRGVDVEAAKIFAEYINDYLLTQEQGYVVLDDPESEHYLSNIVKSLGGDLEVLYDYVSMYEGISIVQSIETLANDEGIPFIIEGAVIYGTIAGLSNVEGSLIYSAINESLAASGITGVSLEQGNEYYINNIISTLDPVIEILYSNTLNTKEDIILTEIPEATDTSITIEGEDGVLREYYFANMTQEAHSIVTEGINTYLESIGAEYLSADITDSSSLIDIVSNVAGVAGALLNGIDIQLTQTNFEPRALEEGSILIPLQADNGTIYNGVLEGYNPEETELISTSLLEYMNEHNIEVISADPSSDVYIGKIMGEVGGAANEAYIGGRETSGFTFVSEEKEIWLPFIHNGRVTMGVLTGYNAENTFILSKALLEYIDAHEDVTYLSMHKHSSVYIGNIIEEIGGAYEVLYKRNTLHGASVKNASPVLEEANGAEVYLLVQVDSAVMKATITGLGEGEDVILMNKINNYMAENNIANLSSHGKNSISDVIAKIGGATYSLYGDMIFPPLELSRSDNLFLSRLQALFSLLVAELEKLHAQGKVENPLAKKDKYKRNRVKADKMDVSESFATAVYYAPLICSAINSNITQVDIGGGVQLDIGMLC